MDAEDAGKRRYRSGYLTELIAGFATALRTLRPIEIHFLGQLN